MKILQVCPAFYPAIAIGGPIFTVLSLQSVLVSKGNLVDVLSTQLGLRDQEEAAIVFNTPMPMPSPVPYSTVASLPGHIVYQKYYGYPHFTFSPRSFLWLLANVKNYDFVVMHGIWNFPVIAASFACRIRKVKYCIFPHGTLYRETIQLRSAKKKAIFLSLFVRRMLKHAERVIFTTQDEKDKVIDYLSLDCRPFVMPNIVNSTNFEQLPRRGAFRSRHGISADALILLHYGRITRKKGIESALQSLAKLSLEFPTLVLALVGGDEEGYRAVIENRAMELGVFGRVIFTGMVNHEESLTVLVDSDIFVLPSLSENFGMAVVEAMLCRLPVVISNNVGISPDIGSANAGFVVELTPGNEPLTNAIGTLLRDSVRRHALGARGRQYAIEHYDVDAVASDVDRLLALVGGEICIIK